jgi:hypothetical protein
MRIWSMNGRRISGSLAWSVTMFGQIADQAENGTAKHAKDANGGGALPKPGALNFGGPPVLTGFYLRDLRFHFF